MSDGPVEPANEQQQKSRSADGRDAAEDQALRSGEEEIAVVGHAAGTGEMKAVFGEMNLIFARPKKNGLNADEK